MSRESTSFFFYNSAACAALIQVKAEDNLKTTLCEIKLSYYVGASWS